MSTSTSESAPPGGPRRGRPARVVRRSAAIPLGGAEIALAALAALVLALVCVRAAPFRTEAGQRAFAPGAREAAPAAGATGAHAVEHAVVDAPDLAARRASVAALSAGRIPLWEPRVSGGTPWLANPRHGVFDPETLAAAAVSSADPAAAVARASAFGAWLRLALAGLGAYVLARRLGTGAAAAALAGVGFAGCGLALGHVAGAAGHALAAVPWVFVAIDRLRTHAWTRGVAFTALATAWLAFSGPVEVTSVVVLAALAFATADLEGRARGAACGGLLLGLACASPALFAWGGAWSATHAFAVANAARGGLDALALGLLVVTAAIVVAWRALADEEDEAERARRTAEFGRHMAAAVRGERVEPSAEEASGAPSAWRSSLGLVGLVVAITTCAWVVARRGSAERARAFLLPDAFARPEAPSIADLAAFARHGAAWVAAVVAALALVSLLSARGPLRARRTLQATTLVALVLALGAGGFVALGRHAPFLGLVDGVGAAAVSALGLALLAAEALDGAPRPARRAGALAFVLLVGMCLIARPPAAPRFAPDPDEPYFAVTERPPAGWSSGAAVFAGYVTTSLPCEALALRRELIDDDGRTIVSAGEPATLTLAAPDAVGRRAFRSEALTPEDLEPGTWRFSLTFLRSVQGGAEAAMGTRVAAYARVEREPRIGVVSMACTMGAFLLILFVAGARGRSAWLAPVLAFVQVFLWSGRLWSETSPPAAPERGGVERAADDVRAVAAFLARQDVRQDARGRVLVERDVFPGDTVLDLGLAAACGGEDFLGARMTELRSHGMRAPDRDVFAFEPADVDPRSNAVRLLGVTHAVTRAPIPGEGWELVAGPREVANGGTELPLCVSRSTAALPRAFCVTRLVEEHRAMSGTAAFDPATEAFLDEGRHVALGHPAARTDVRVERDEPESVRVVAQLDGDALLVLADAFAAGWTATVDGRATEVLAVDGALRGVALDAGRHVVEFTYAPRGVAFALWIGWIGLVAAWILALVPGARRVEPPQAAEPVA